MTIPERPGWTPKSLESRSSAVEPAPGVQHS
jgi:hypothetical protein